MAEVVEVHTPEGSRPRPKWRLAVAGVVAASFISGAAGYWLGGRDEGDEAGSEVVAGDGGTEAAVSEATATGDTASGETVSGGTASRSMTADGGIGPAATPVLARTAQDGTIIRVLEARWPAEPAPPPGGGWVPPPVCRPLGNLEIGFTTDVYTTSGWSEIFEEAEGPAALWGGGWSGHPQLGAILFAAVHVTDEVAAVQLLHQGAAVDESAPTGDWVVVAAQLPAADPVAAERGVGPSGEIVVLGTDGAELARRPVDRPDVPYERAECQPPPPTLPDSVRPAGDADAAAADDIRAAFEGAFGRGVDGEPKARPFVQSGDQLDDAFFEELRTRTAELGISEVRADVREVGFIDDRTAVVVFTLEGAPLGWMLGEAVLLDGAWKVSSQTWCALVEMAVGTCPPGMRDPDRGPSRFDVYQREG